MAIKQKTLPKGITHKSNGAYKIAVCVNGQRAAKTLYGTLPEALKEQERMRAELLIASVGNSATSGTTLPAIGNISNISGTSLLGINVVSTTSTAWTLEQAADHAYTMLWSDKPSEVTSRLIIKEMLTYFGASTSCAAITAEIIAGWVQHMMHECNARNTTINRKLSVLSSILRMAQEYNKISHMPKVPRRKVGQGRTRFITLAEEQTLINLLQQMGKPDHAEAVIVLLDTGMRTGELWRMDVRHLNFDADVIHIWKTKTDKPRTIPMTQRVKAILLARSQRHKGLLWPQGSTAWIRSAWERARAAMGESSSRDFVPHILRHTCCSRLVQRGVPLTHVQLWMGHQSISTTMLYSHLAPQNLRGLAGVLEDATATWSNQG